MCAVKIGWAKRDISTTEPVNINGQAYLRISEGIHDPVMVTALVLEGEDAAIFVSCDLNSVLAPVVQLTREKVSAVCPEIPTEHIVLNSTHTHSAGAALPTPEKTPDGRDIYPGERYREFVTDRIAEAVCEAWKNRKEGGIAYGYGYAVVGHSRRVVYTEDQGKAKPNNTAPNGFGVMYGNTRKPAFSHYEAGADHFLNVMYTFDAANRLTGMVVNVPCPSQLSEHFTKLSADYWHEVRTMAAKEFGEEVFVLPQCAAAGDLSPRLLHYKEAQARRMRLKYGLCYDPKLAKNNNDHEYNKVMAERYDIAGRILAGVKEIYAWARKDIRTDVTVRHVTAPVRLTARIITEDEKQQCLDNIEQLDSQLAQLRRDQPEDYSEAASRLEWMKSRNLRVLGRHEAQKTTPTDEHTLYITRVGEIAFAASPFELYMDYMHRIQARSPFVQTFVVQMADDYGTYLPTSRAAFNKGYSASMFCNRVGPEGGQELVEYTLSVLQEMNK